MSSTPLRFAPWIVLLGALTAIGPLSIDMYLPSFPTLEKTLGPGAQLSLASFFIGMAIGQTVYGPLSDRFGRKPPLLAGLTLYILASLGCSFATTMPQLVLGRFIQALGGCAGMVISRAVVRDRCEPTRAAQVFSMLMLVMGLAPILAPLLGSWLLTAIGWQSIFWFKAAFALACLAGLYAWLPESHAGNSTPLRLGAVLRDFGRLLTDRHFMGYTLSSGLAMAGLFAYIAGSPHLLIEIHGIDPAHYGWVFGANAFGLIAASQVNARLLGRYRMDALLCHALWVPALATATMLLAELGGVASLPVLLTGFFIYLTSMGFIAPNGGALAMAKHGQLAGTASALMGVLQFGLASVLGAILGLWQRGDALPLLVLMALCGVGALVWHRTMAPYKP